MESEIRHCRLCFSEDINENNIFQMVDENGLSFNTKIILCTSLMIAEEDLFSNFICNNCMQMIELFYEFRNTCLKTHISMYNIANGSSQDKFSLTNNNENLRNENDGDEVEIFSEKNVSDNPVEIESIDYLNNTTNNCDDNSELRQFQVGCYIPMLDVENSSQITNDNDLLLRRFKCMNCKSIYSTLIELDNHWDICENVKTNFEVTVVNGDLVSNQEFGEVFEEEKEVNEIIDEEQIIDKLECKTKKQSPKKEFCCETCGQVFKQLCLLKRHLQVKHICIRPYSCSHCNRKFFDKYELKYHQRLHEDIDDFCCNICKRRFSRRSGLKTHMRSHTGEKPFNCKLCNKNFAHLHNLLTHERVHTGERPYLCKYCPRTFTQYSTAKSHEGMHMGGLRLYQCDICDRMFKTESDMSVHRLTHEGLHEFKCLICNREFKKQSDLNKHNQRFHCNNKPYPCNHCSKSYITLRELQLHTTLHTGELPYTCLLCSKSYRLSSTLKRHMQKHHPESHISDTFGTSTDL